MTSNQSVYWRRFFWGVGSLALTASLIVLLVKISRIDLRDTVQQLRSVTWLSFAKLLLLNGLLVYLSTEKWRSIDAAWRRPADTVPSTTTSYALTSFGLAIGIVLPVQLAMSTARTMGTHVHGRALKRGTAGTLYEQGFDLLTVGFLAAASALTRVYQRGALMWTIAATAAVLLALLIVGPLVRAVRWRPAPVAPSVPKDAPALKSNWLRTALRNLSQMRHSNLVDAGLARRLVMLSTLRFVVVVLMSAQTADAVHLHIAVWQMAAAVPFVVMASVIAITPGGIGVNELTSVTALKVFGTPMAVGAQWALANRVLIAASYFSVAILAAAALATQQLFTAHATRGNLSTQFKP